MLPLPGSPSSSWALYRQKLENMLSGPQLRVAAAFFIFGILNNVFGVMIVAAALDLVGPHIPKGTVLLATVLPSVCSKLTLPYVIHVVPYSSRILIFSTLSTVGMLLVALTPSYSGTDPSATTKTSTDFGLAVGVKILGIVLASLSGGAGELSFLGLTHYYGSTGLAAWGSGTGAAGLVGAGAYAFVTGPLGVGVRKTLLGSAAWPFGMAVAYFAILPQGPMKMATAAASAKSSRAASSANSSRERASSREERGLYGDEGGEEDEEMVAAMARSDQGLLSGHTVVSSSASSSSLSLSSLHTAWTSSLQANMRRARSLFVPFMLPLFIVYVGEYTINQGVTPTLLFPLSAATPFKRYREFYPAYATIYQVGVFVSRSSIFFPSLRFHALYPPAFMQLANLAFLVAHAIFDFIPNVYFVFLVIFWEGLLGGGVYVNAFSEILDKVPEEDREFSLSLTSVSDSMGILLASFLGMALEVSLCYYQVKHGRDYCNKI